MSLKINTIQKKGNEHSEYILLKAEKDVTLSNFAVVDRTYDNGGKISNLNKHFFRFPNYSLKEGQYVALFTGKGKNSEGKVKSGEYCLFVYWGLDKPILNDGEIESIDVLQVVTRDNKKVA